MKDIKKYIGSIILIIAKEKKNKDNWHNNTSYSSLAKSKKMGDTK